MVFVYNKLDMMPDIMEVKRLADMMSAQWGAPHFFTSALTGENVEHAFRKLAELVARG